MSLKFPDKIEHSNDNLYLIDSDFVKGGRRVVSNLTELYQLSATKSDLLKEFVTEVYVQSQNNHYILTNLSEADNSSGWTANPLFTPYSLPVATNSTLGGIKLGSGLSINESSVVSVKMSGNVNNLSKFTSTDGIGNANITDNGTVITVSPPDRFIVDTKMFTIYSTDDFSFSYNISDLNTYLISKPYTQKGLNFYTGYTITDDLLTWGGSNNGVNINNGYIINDKTVGEVINSTYLTGLDVLNSVLLDTDGALNLGKHFSGINGRLQFSSKSQTTAPTVANSSFLYIRTPNNALSGSGSVVSNVNFYAHIFLESISTGSITNKYAIYQIGTSDINLFNGIIRLPNLPNYVDNAAAITAGLAVGTLYRTGGDVKIVI